MDKESVSTQRAPIDAAPVAVITSSVCTYILSFCLMHAVMGSGRLHAKTIDVFTK